MAQNQAESSYPLPFNATSSSITCSGPGATTVNKDEDITPEFTNLMERFAYFYNFLTEKEDMLEKMNSEISAMRQAATDSQDLTKNALAAIEEKMHGLSTLRMNYEKSLSEYVDHEIAELNRSQEIIQSDIQAQSKATCALAKDLTKLTGRMDNADLVFHEETGAWKEHLLRFQSQYKNYSLSTDIYNHPVKDDAYDEMQSITRWEDVRNEVVEQLSSLHTKMDYLAILLKNSGVGQIDFSTGRMADDPDCMASDAPLDGLSNCAEVGRVNPDSMYTLETPFEDLHSVTTQPGDIESDTLVDQLSDEFAGVNADSRGFLGDIFGEQDEGRTIESLLGVSENVNQDLQFLESLHGVHLNRVDNLPTFGQDMSFSNFIGMEECPDDDNMDRQEDQLSKDPRTCNLDRFELSCVMEPHDVPNDDSNRRDYQVTYGHNSFGISHLTSAASAATLDIANYYIFSKLFSLVTSPISSFHHPSYKSMISLALRLESLVKTHGTSPKEFFLDVLHGPSLRRRSTTQTLELTYDMPNTQTTLVPLSLSGHTKEHVMRLTKISTISAHFLAIISLKTAGGLQQWLKNDAPYNFSFAALLLELRFTEVSRRSGQLPLIPPSRVRCSKVTYLLHTQAISIIVAVLVAFWVASLKDNDKGLTWQSYPLPDSMRRSMRHRVLREEEIGR